MCWRVKSTLADLGEKALTQPLALNLVGLFEPFLTRTTLGEILQKVPGEFPVLVAVYENDRVALCWSNDVAA